MYISIAMPITRFILLILKIFFASFVIGTTVFIASVYVNTIVLNFILPVGMQVRLLQINGILNSLLTGFELSLFFTAFIILVIRQSILSGVIFTLRDIVQYYKKFITLTFFIIMLFVCGASIFIVNFSQNKPDIQSGLVNGAIITYALPCFWLILAVFYYRNYQSKINEPDGCKDRSWLEGNTEK